jgi:hypothetical protein
MGLVKSGYTVSMTPDSTDPTDSTNSTNSTNSTDPIYLNGIVRYQSCYDGLPARGWFHPCIWCATISANRMLIPHRMVSSPETIRLRDGSVLRFNELDIPACQICESILWEVVSPTQVHMMDVVTGKMIRCMRWRTPMLVRYK